MYDLLIVGAGPCGLATAIAAHRAGLDYLVLEQGGVVHAIFRFPRDMVFFSTPDLLAIGDVPFIVAGEKPTRSEALAYYRKVAQAFGLRLRLYERVVEAVREGDGFAVRAVPTLPPDGLAAAGQRTYRARALAIATGYFDHPNRLGIPGEDLPKVSHYYDEGHPYCGLDVVVVGGNNSAVEAALDLRRCGARVTLVHRGEGLGAKVKPWVRPLIESALAKGHIRALFRSRLVEVGPEHVLIEREGERVRLANDFVFALTGFRPDHTLLRRLGVEIDEATGEPRHDPETMETNVPGLFLAGVVAAGYDANKIFIENGRFHGERIVRCLLEAGRAAAR